MSTMKKFLKYFLVFLAFYFLSNIISIQLLKTTYKTKEFTIDSDSPKIEITDSKATITNGYVNGKIFNNTGSDLIGKYLKADFFSARGVNVGTKYVDIGTLLAEESTDFEIKYNFDNVDNIKFSFVDQEDLPKDKKLLDFSLDDIKLDRFKFPWYIWLAATIMAFG